MPLLDLSASGVVGLAVVGRLTNNQIYYYVTRLRRVLQIPKIKNSPPLLDLSASGGTCAPLAHRLTNNYE